MKDYPLRPIGWVRSPLKDVATAPKQGDEGAPTAVIEFESWVADGLKDLPTDTDIWVFTWLDRADRDVLTVRPRGDLNRPFTGVFSTRSPHRPNPIGLHRIHIIGIDGLRFEVAGLEAVDGTPIVDVKPLLGEAGER